MSLPARFAGIAKAVSARVGAPFLDGEIPQVSTQGRYDDDGNWAPGTAGTPIAVKVQIDSLSEGMRAQAGFTDKQYSFVILADGLTVPLNADSRVKVTDPNAPAGFLGEWLVSSLTRDSAGLCWTGRAVKA